MPTQTLAMNRVPLDVHSYKNIPVREERFVPEAPVHELFFSIKYAQLPTAVQHQQATSSLHNTPQTADRPAPTDRGRYT